MKEKRQKNKKGSALVLAVIIMMVVMMLSLALLLVSFSMSATAVKQQNLEQCKELAQSLSNELEAEITITFDSYAEQKKALEEDQYQLWFYLRYNICQSSWLSYDPDNGHTEDAYRYFNVNVGTADTNVADDISVIMYWEGDREAVQEADQTSLIVRVTCKKGKQKSVITSTYELEAKEAYTDPPSDGQDPGIGKLQVNPNGIGLRDLGIKWIWNQSSIE